MPSRLLIFLCCMIAPLALSACGGDDEPSEGGGGDFISQADEICTAAARDVVATQDEPPGSPEESISVLEEQLEIRSKALEDLRALAEPPSDVASAWEEHLAARQKRISLVEEEIALLEQGVDPTAPEYEAVVAKIVEAVEQGEVALADTDFEACAAKLPPEVEEEVTAIVTEFETQPLEDCTEFMTDSAIEELFGGLQECQRVQENPPPEGFTEEVDVTDISGIEKLSVEVEASLAGGVGDGQDVIYGLVYEDGTYKVNSVISQPEE